MYRPQYAPVDASRCRILVDAPRSHETAHSCDTKLVIPPPGHAAQPPVTLEVQMFDEARGDGSLSAQEGVGLFLLQREALRRNDPPGGPSLLRPLKSSGGHQHRFSTRQTRVLQPPAAPGHDHGLILFAPCSREREGAGRLSPRSEQSPVNAGAAGPV